MVFISTVVNALVAGIYWWLNKTISMLVEYGYTAIKHLFIVLYNLGLMILGVVASIFYGFYAAAKNIQKRNRERYKKRREQERSLERKEKIQDNLNSELEIL